MAVLGARGLLGHAVVRALAAEGVETVAVDLRPPTAELELPRVEQVVGDVHDREWRASLGGCGLLVNLVGTGDHAGSMRDPAADLRENCLPTLSALDAAAEAGIRNVVYASSRQVYGVPVRVPLDEEHPVRPVDLNGVHRYACELYHAVYARRYGIAYAVIRFSNIYGPGLQVDGNPMFLAKWIAAARAERPFELWDGGQRRDLVYVDDAAAAVLAASGHCTLSGAAFNCGGAEPVSLAELAARLERHGLSYRVVEFPVERAAIEVGDPILDSGLLQRQTGWQPQVALDDGLARTLAGAGLAVTR